MSCLLFFFLFLIQKSKVEITLKRMQRIEYPLCLENHGEIRCLLLTILTIDFEKKYNDIYLKERK